MKKIDKPWGYELIWAESARYVGKILHIKAGQMLSRQYHVVKEETLLLQSGHMLLEIGLGPNMSLIEMLPGDVQHISPGTVHRMIARVDTDVVEVSTPELDDVVRLEDSYGRVSS